MVPCICAAFFVGLKQHVRAAEGGSTGEQKRLYVAEPGIRDYLQYGGHGVLVFDIDHGHRFVKRIPAAGLDEKGRPLNVKGICANASTRRLYVTTTRTLTCFDLVREKILWEKAYEIAMRSQPPWYAFSQRIFSLTRSKQVSVLVVVT